MPAVMVVPVMMVPVPVNARRSIIGWRCIVAGRGVIALLNPTPAIPDRPADQCDVLNVAGFNLSQTGRAGQGLGSAPSK